MRRSLDGRGEGGVSFSATSTAGGGEGAAARRCVEGAESAKNPGRTAETSPIGRIQEGSGSAIAYEAQ